MLLKACQEHQKQSSLHRAVLRPAEIQKRATDAWPGHVQELITEFPDAPYFAASFGETELVVEYRKGVGFHVKSFEHQPMLTTPDGHAVLALLREIADAEGFSCQEAP